MEHADHGRRLVGVDKDPELNLHEGEEHATIVSIAAIAVSHPMLHSYHPWWLKLIQGIDPHIVLSCMYGGPMNPCMPSYIDH